MNTPLENWLRLATRGLSAESAAQVRVEIGEHYDAAIAEGATDAEAIAGLGDARAANREYRKVLLSRFDAKWLKLVKQRNFSAVSPWMRINVAILSIASALKFVEGQPRDAWPTLSLAFFFVVLYMAGRVDIRSRRTVYVYRALRLASVVCLPLVHTLAGRSHPPLWLYLILPCAACCPAYWDYRLRRRLPVERWPKGLYL